MADLTDNPCHKCKANNGYTLHGRCNNCGFGKYPSVTLMRRRLRRQ